QALCVCGRDQKVDVVGHQHVGVDGALIVGGGKAEPFAVARVILGGKEDGVTVVAALDHVQRLIGKKVPAQPRHGRTAAVQVSRANLTSDAGKIYSDPNLISSSHFCLRLFRNSGSIQ